MIAQRLVAFARADRPPLWFRLLTAPLARLYAAVLAIREHRFASPSFQSWHPPGKVISIGNVAAGGTGKTPVVIALAQHLVSLGARPAILTRGYGAGLARGDFLVLRAGEVVLSSRASLPTADEGMLVSRSVPKAVVGIGADRIATARRLLSHLDVSSHPTHWILDDGFQHRQICRDVDIVLLDAHRPFGCGRLIPSGDQRESAAALTRATAVIFTRSDLGAPSKETCQRVASLTSAPQFAAPFTMAMPKGICAGEQHDGGFDRARHSPIWLVSGIARPDVLREGVRRLGLEVAAELRGADHAPFAEDSLRKVPEGCRAIVTTEKDWWRQPEVFSRQNLPVFVLPLTADIPAPSWQKILGNAANSSR